MFNDITEKIINNGVSTIRIKYIIPKGIITISWSWTDDEEQLYTKKLNNVIYFTD